MIDVSGLSPSTVWTTPLLRIPVPHPKPHSQPGQAPLLTVDPLRSLQWVPGQLTPKGPEGPLLPSTLADLGSSSLTFFPTLQKAKLKSDSSS